MEINALGEKGIVICQMNYNIRIQSFICDTPARAFMKLTKGHCGYSACERCVVRGVRKGNRMVYEDIDSVERTGEFFVRCETKNIIMVDLFSFRLNLRSTW